MWIAIAAYPSYLLWTHGYDRGKKRALKDNAHFIAAGTNIFSSMRELKEAYKFCGAGLVAKKRVTSDFGDEGKITLALEYSEPGNAAAPEIETRIIDQ